MREGAAASVTIWNSGDKNDGVAALTCTRRTALKIGLSCPGLAATAGAFEGQALGGFIALSAKLTGFPAHDLDAQFANALLQALAANGVAVEALRQGDDGALPADVAVEIVSAWYTGVLPTVPQPTVGTFHDALVWRALDFTSARSVCAQPGAWADAPASIREGE